MAMFRRTISGDGWIRWRYLKPTVILVGLLMILFIAPVSNATDPVTTLNGEWQANNSNQVVTHIEGVRIITADTALTFTGGVDGVMTGSLTVILMPPIGFGHFTVVTSGLFDGTIDGKAGTAQFNSVVNGVGEPFPCCYQGPINFHDGTDDLMGLSATGVFTRDQINGQRYSLDVTFPGGPD